MIQFRIVWLSGVEVSDSRSGVLLEPLVIFMITICEGHRLHSQYLSRLGESVARISSPCYQIGNIFKPVRLLADWSTSRYLFPLIVRIGSCRRLFR